MKRRVGSNLVLYSVAGLSAALAVALAYAYLEKRLAEQREQLQGQVVRVVEAPDLRTVVVAGRDVYRGRRLTTEDLKVLQVPVEGILLEDVVTRPGDAVGRIALGPMYAGEWVVGRKLAAPDDPREGLDNLLEPGHRAIRIPVTRVSGLLGVLEPDDRVDLIGVFPGGESQQPISRTLLQNVPVLAVGRQGLPGIAGGEGDAEPVDASESSVTLDVTRQGAEIVALALQIGRIQLALRNKADLAAEDSVGIGVRQLGSVNAVQEPPPPTPRRPAKTIQVLHGERIERQAIP